MDYSTHATVPTLQHPPPPPHRHHHCDPTLSLIVGHRSQLHKPLSPSPQSCTSVTVSESKLATGVLADASRWPLLSHMRSRAPRSYLSPTPLLPATGALTCYLLYFCISVFVLRYLYFFRYFVISVFHFHVLYCIFSSSFLVLPGAGSSQRAGARPNPTCHRRDLLNYTKHASG